MRPVQIKFGLHVNANPCLRVYIKPVLKITSNRFEVNSGLILALLLYACVFAVKCDSRQTTRGKLDVL